MIDLNHQLKFHEQVTVLVDVALQAENATREKRRYLGGSRLGVACERALQFEYADAPVDGLYEQAADTGLWPRAPRQIRVTTSKGT